MHHGLLLAGLPAAAPRSSEPDFRMILGTLATSLMTCNLRNLCDFLQSGRRSQRRLLHLRIVGVRVWVLSLQHNLDVNYSLSQQSQLSVSFALFALASKLESTVLLLSVKEFTTKLFLCILHGSNWWELGCTPQSAHQRTYHCVVPVQLRQFSPPSASHLCMVTEMSTNLSMNCRLMNLHVFLWTAWTFGTCFCNTAAWFSGLRCSSPPIVSLGISTVCSTTRFSSAFWWHAVINFHGFLHGLRHVALTVSSGDLRNPFLHLLDCASSTSVTLIISSVFS